MTDSLPQAVRDAADISAVSQLVLRERLSPDLGFWDQMRDCFHDDLVVRISWINASGPEFVRRSKEMAERNVKASHRTRTNLRHAGRRSRNRAARRHNRHPVYAKRNRGDGVQPCTISGSRAERREEVWRLSGFDVFYLRDEMAAIIPGQTVAVDLEAVKTFRPTYRLLSYCLASNGFPVSNDLAEIDRSDLVNALLREVYGWAGLTPPH